MKEYLITVVMPCYNVENYIEETLQSIFEQTCQDFEIICIDDGSTDSTLSLLQKNALEHSNMQVISETNHRQGYERNLGIRKAKGKYIYYMDSDDLLAPKCFEIISEYAEKNQLDLLFFEGTTIYENDELEEKYPKFKTLYFRKNEYPGVYRGEDLYIELRKNGEMIVSPCLQLVRRQLLLEKDIKFPELPLMEDNLYIFDCLLKAERTGCIPNRLFIRRVRESSSMTSERCAEQIYALEFTLRKMLEVSEKYIDRQEIYNTIIGHTLGIVRQLSNIYDQCPMEKHVEVAKKVDGVTMAQVTPTLMMLDTKLKNIIESSKKITEQLNQAWTEKSKINDKLQQTYKEKSEINAKLQQTYKEKSEINANLKQMTENNKSLKEKLRQKKIKCDKKEARIKVLEERVKELEGFLPYRIFRKIKSIIKR